MGSFACDPNFERLYPGDCREAIQWLEDHLRCTPGLWLKVGPYRSYSHDPAFPRVGLEIRLGNACALTTFYPRPKEGISILQRLVYGAGPWPSIRLDLESVFRHDILRIPCGANIRPRSPSRLDAAGESAAP